MEREELYHKTVDALLDAYNAGELAHSNCECCAVGNICKEASKLTNINNAMWGNLFYTNSYGTQIMPEFLTDDSEQLKKWREDAKKLIEATGYSMIELMRIEYAFETSIQKTPEGQTHWLYKERLKEGQFIGLCAVLDVLKDIHEVELDSHETSVSKLTVIKDKFLVEA